MQIKFTLKEMVDSFIKERRQECINYLEELSQKGKEKSYDEFIKVALTSYPEHKWYVERFGNEKAFREAAILLKKKEKEILSSEIFDDLIKIINDLKIVNFGELSKYDTALAIGAYIGKLPDKIFMHEGPKKAAKFIYGNSYNDKVRYLIRPNRIQYINVEDLPEEFNELKESPYLIEDCLCYIYSTYLR